MPPPRNCPLPPRTWWRGLTPIASLARRRHQDAGRLTTENLVARAHAHRQGIPYETGERWLEQLPERLRALAVLVLGGKMQGGGVAYALAVLIDGIEHAPADGGPRRH